MMRSRAVRQRKLLPILKTPATDDPSDALLTEDGEPLLTEDGSDLSFEEGS